MITKPPTPPLPPCPAVLMDTNAHCVLVYDRRVKWATVILNDASGPYVKELSISKLDHEFTRPLYVEPHDVLFGAMSFYKNHDIGGDGVWDVWQLESPNMLWYFRGSPHVHVWVNIRERG